MDIQEILKLHHKWLNNEEGGVRADLRGSDLSEANLRGSDLCGADLRNSDLSRADLRNSDLRGADLSGSNLSEANLRGSNLCNSDLSKANLSRAKNLANHNSADYIMANFDKTEEGIVVYKTFGFHSHPNPNWKIEKGAIIEENVNPNRTEECGCGVNVGTLEWVKKHGGRRDIWKCLIKWEWLPDVVVPYHTDGKIRAGRVQLLEVI
jgi:hypothetical protein